MPDGRAHARKKPALARRAPFRRSAHPAELPQLNFIHTDCMVQNRDPSRDIVLTVFPWPSTLPADFHTQQRPQRPVQGVWAIRSASGSAAASSNSMPSVSRGGGGKGKTPTQPKERPRLGLLLKARAAAHAKAFAHAKASAESATATSNSLPHQRGQRRAETIAASLSDEDNDVPETLPTGRTARTVISEDQSWQDAYTLMMLYKRVRGRRPGDVDCFVVPTEPTMTLTQPQREVVARACQNLFFGFTSKDSAKDLTELISTMQKAMDHRKKYHAEHEYLSEQAS